MSVVENKLFEEASKDQEGGELSFQDFSHVGEEQENVAEYAPPPPSSLPSPGTSPEDEPPLLEELGIHPEQILEKTARILVTPWTFRSPSVDDSQLMKDPDLAGPLFFTLLLGMALLFKGRVHFGAIYGVGTLGCLGLYAVLNGMSERNISIAQTLSVLGYALLPMVGLVILEITVLPMWAILRAVMLSLTVIWCSHASSSLFVALCALREQRWLVVYPVVLLYAGFGLLSAF